MEDVLCSDDIRYVWCLASTKWCSHVIYIDDQVSSVHSHTEKLIATHGAKVFYLVVNAINSHFL